jgi:hypothetical protein
MRKMPSSPKVSMSFSGSRRPPAATIMASTGRGY